MSIVSHRFRDRISQLLAIPSARRVRELPQVLALMPMLYDDLRRIAARILSRAPHGQTLPASAFGNESVQRLAQDSRRQLAERSQSIDVFASAEAPTRLEQAPDSVPAATFAGDAP